MLDMGRPVKIVDLAHNMIRLSGKEPGRDPYFRHFYRIGFDGTGLTLLTPEDADHTIELSPDAQMASWARRWFDTALPHCAGFGSPRAIAFVMLGAAQTLSADRHLAVGGAATLSTGLRLNGAISGVSYALEYAKQSDLSDYADAPTVKFRFVFSSGIAIFRDGYNFRNVEVGGVPRKSGPLPAAASDKKK